MTSSSPVLLYTCNEGHDLERFNLITTNNMAVNQQRVHAYKYMNIITPQVVDCGMSIMTLFCSVK